MIIKLNELAETRNNYIGKKVGLCCGGFDLLHPGHINFIKQSKAGCDILFVGVRNDKSISLEKGFERPIMSDVNRAIVVDSLKYTDFTFITKNNKTHSGLAKLETIQDKLNWEEYTDVFNTLKPDIFFLVNNHTLSQKFLDMVNNLHIKIEIINYSTGYSSTEMIKEIKNR